DGASPVPPSQVRQSDRPVWYFGNGRAAMFLSGPWDLARLKREFGSEVPVATAPLPRGPNGTVGDVAGGGGVFIPRGTKRRRLAFELMLALTSDTTSLRLAREATRLPVRRRLYDDPWIRSQPDLQKLLLRMDVAQPFPLEVVPEAAQAFIGAVQGALVGRDVDALLADAQARGDAPLADLYP